MVHPKRKISTPKEIDEALNTMREWSTILNNLKQNQLSTNTAKFQSRIQMVKILTIN